MSDLEEPFLKNGDKEAELGEEAEHLTNCLKERGEMRRANKYTVFARSQKALDEQLLADLSLVQRDGLICEGVNYRQYIGGVEIFDGGAPRSDETPGRDEYPYACLLTLNTWLWQLIKILLGAAEYFVSFYSNLAFACLIFDTTTKEAGRDVIEDRHSLLSIIFMVVWILTVFVNLFMSYAMARREWDDACRDGDIVCSFRGKCTCWFTERWPTFLCLVLVKLLRVPQLVAKLPMQLHPCKRERAMLAATIDGESSSHRVFLIGVRSVHEWRCENRVGLFPSMVVSFVSNLALAVLKVALYWQEHRSALFLVAMVLLPSFLLAFNAYETWSLGRSLRNYQTLLEGDRGMNSKDVHVKEDSQKAFARHFSAKKTNEQPAERLGSPTDLDVTRVDTSKSCVEEQDFARGVAALGRRIADEKKNAEELGVGLEVPLQDALERCRLEMLPCFFDVECQSGIHWEQHELPYCLGPFRLVAIERPSIRRFVQLEQGNLLEEETSAFRFWRIKDMPGILGHSHGTVEKFEPARISLPQGITLEGDARDQASIPRDAVSFSWCYPLKWPSVTAQDELNARMAIATPKRSGGRRSSRRRSRGSTPSGERDFQEVLQEMRQEQMREKRLSCLARGERHDGEKLSEEERRQSPVVALMFWGGYIYYDYSQTVVGILAAVPTRAGEVPIDADTGILGFGPPRALDETLKSAVCLDEGNRQRQKVEWLPKSSRLHGATFAWVGPVEWCHGHKDRQQVCKHGGFAFYPPPGGAPRSEPQSPERGVVR